MKKRINNVNIKQCFDPLLNKKVVDENFYECIHKNSNNPKILGAMPNKPSKEVEEELTNITNNLLIDNIDFTNRLFEAIYENFGTIDNDNLTPYIEGTINQKINNDIYFVFKGGNTIKLWVNKSYLEKINDLTTQYYSTTNLQDILSFKIPEIFHENRAINSASDFDFSLYINFKKLDENEQTEVKLEEKYAYILKNIGRKMLSLRRDTDNIIDDKQIDNYNNSNKLLTEIKKYIQNINNNKTNIENIKLYFPKNGNDFILARKNNNIIIYNRKVNYKHVVSFNTIIQKQESNNLDDFDLFRIKLGIVANYNYNYISDARRTRINDTTRPLKSEFFDLSILRKTDSKIQKMCDNITEYTQIIHVEFNNKIIPIRIYNIKYLIIDLLRMLFDNAPWNDIKYNKRIIRLAILMSLYNQQQIIDNPKEYGIEIFMIFNILHIIYFFIEDDGKNNDISSNILIFQKIIEENLTNIRKTQLPDSEIINNIINGDEGYDNIKYYMDYYLYLNKPNEFLCYILLLFIRKILIESDEEWYLFIIKDRELFPYNDFSEIKLLLIKLLKTYIFHIINTTLILTDLKTVLITCFGEQIIENIKEDLKEDLYNNQDGGKFPDSGKYQLETVINPFESVQTFTKLINKPTYELVQFEEIKQLEELKQFENKIQNEIKKNSNNYLSKLLKINNYFENKEHKYLLKSDMKLEIIRNIKNEDNIIDVFNILKDILQLDKDKDKDKDKDYEYEYY